MQDNMSRKIHVVGTGRAYAAWMQGDLIGDPEKADLFVFTGGEDVNPELYGKKKHPFTWFSNRDVIEKEYFDYAVEHGKKMVGICRGAQLLCALSGGILVQHQEHPYLHDMFTSTGEPITTTSTHHQRQFPWGGKKPKFELLAWTKPGFSSYSQGESKEDDMYDPETPEAEVVLYPETLSLSIQGHPEHAYPSFAPWEEKFIGYCRTQLDRLMKL